MPSSLLEHGGSRHPLLAGPLEVSQVYSQPSRDGQDDGNDDGDAGEDGIDNDHMVV